jgi:hypothetical protein
MKCVCGHDKLIERLRQSATLQSPEYVKAIVDLADCNDSLRARIAAMREAMVERQWNKYDGGVYWCSVCENNSDVGHAPDCSYARLLKETE